MAPIADGDYYTLKQSVALLEQRLTDVEKRVAQLEAIWGRATWAVLAIVLAAFIQWILAGGLKIVAGS